MKLSNLFKPVISLGFGLLLSACPSEPLESPASYAPDTRPSTMQSQQSAKQQANSTSLPRRLSPTPSLPPRPIDLTTQSNYQPNGVYSSLILDARGLRVGASMSPSILVNQQQVYPPAGELDTDYLVNVGLAAYVYGSLNQAKQSSRAGQNPLIIRPLSAQGPGGSGVTLSPVDGKNLLAAERRSGLLKRFKVIFLLDQTD